MKKGDWLYKHLPVPAALVALCTIFGIKLPLSWLAFSPKIWLTLRLLFGTLALGILGIVAARRRCDARARVVLEPKESPDPFFAAHHPELISTHPDLLEMTQKEFEERSHLTAAEARVVLENPDFVPRADVHKPIRRALMVGDKWPQGGYGDECVKERLRWYRRKGYHAFTDEEIEAWTQEIRAVVLGLIEKLRRKHLERGFK